MKALLETWAISYRVNGYLQVAVKEEHFTDRGCLQGTNGGEHFAHIHNVRVIGINVAAPHWRRYWEDREESSGTRKILPVGLKASAAAMEEILRAGFEAGKIKGCKPHPEAFLDILSHTRLITADRSSWARGKMGICPTGRSFWSLGMGKPVNGPCRLWNAESMGYI